MIRNFLRGPSAAFTTLLCASAVHAAPPVIDSEQSAAGAVLSAHHFMIDRNDGNARQLLINITHPAREVVNKGLSILAAATTPAGLARAGGIVVPCERGGTLSALLPRGQGRNLRMSFNGCVLDQWQLDVTYNGIAELVLTGDKFAVNSTSSLRLGTATQDLTITTFQSFPPYSDITDTRSLNVRMVGLVPMTQRSEGFYFTGSFDYEVTGFWDSFTTIVPPDPIYGGPSEHRHRISAEHVRTSGYLVLPTTSPTEWLDDETTLHSGRLSIYYDNVNGWRDIDESIDVQSLRIRTKELYGNGRQVAVDGRATLNWDTSRGACLSGDYTFETRTPLVEGVSGGSGFFQQGDILVNGVAASRYSPPTQPDPAQPWLWRGPVSILATGVGQFDYLFDWSVQNGLKTVAQCNY